MPVVQRERNSLNKKPYVKHKALKRLKKEFVCPTAH